MCLAIVLAALLLGTASVAVPHGVFRNAGMEEAVGAVNTLAQLIERTKVRQISQGERREPF